MNRPAPACFPSLFQANTRVWLTDIGERLGRPATLDDIPDVELDRLAEAGFDWVWFLSVWQTGAAGRECSRTNPGWRKEFQETLPDVCEEDIAGSGFAITGYAVHKNLGGDAALARLRKRLCQRGLKLMLDFVPNHMALDHPWVETHPEYFVPGSELDLARAPMNYIWVKRERGDLLLAHGRDPYFPGWPDTLQLNYANPATPAAMAGELMRIAGQCDGVRCDMAMLVLPEVFERTWGKSARPFWPDTIRRVREKTPGFCFMAEVYWDLEWTLQQQGFDYTYDKRLYDRLREGRARPVREHFCAAPEYQNKLARFLENHDEPRAAAAFSEAMHKAAAIVTFFSPGLRLFHQGQFEGRLRRVSPHLARAPEETVNTGLKTFYERLLEILRQPVVREGQWQLLECVPAWNGNSSSENFIAFAWQNSAGEKVLAVVNLSRQPAQCNVRLPFIDTGGRQWQLRDRLGAAIYQRDGNDLQARGLYLDVGPWCGHVFEMKATEPGATPEAKSAKAFETHGHRKSSHQP
jgi:glycosidase